MDNKIFLFGVLFIAALLVLGCTAQQKTDTVQKPSEEVQTSAPPVQEMKTETTVKTAEPTVASAREWYGVAKDESTKWRTDAKLIGVSGTNQKKDGSLYPPDGKTDTWIYTFVSILLNEKYILTVKNGEITKNETFPVSMANAVYGTAAGLDAWKIDSYSAVSTINEFGGGKNYMINTPSPIVNYELTFESGSPGSTIWTITYNPPRLGQSLIGRVDATTNSLI